MSDLPSLPSRFVGPQGVETDPEVMRMGGYVPLMFTFRDPDGNRFRMVE